MFSRLKKHVVDNVKAPLGLRDYESLQSLDEDEAAREKMALSAQDSRLMVPLHVVRKLQILKLTVTVLASLLALVCMMWAGREVMAKRSLVTSAQDCKSCHGSNTEHKHIQALTQNSLQWKRDRLPSCKGPRAVFPSTRSHRIQIDSFPQQLSRRSYALAGPTK